jgi:hypothetical protein
MGHGEGNGASEDEELGARNKLGTSEKEQRMQVSDRWKRAAQGIMNIGYLLE